jgi:hypothetical protein
LKIIGSFLMKCHPERIIFYCMKRLLSLFTLIAFLSVSFASASHYHKDTETGGKADCQLCAFSQTTPVALPTQTVPLAPVVLQKMTAPPTAGVVTASLCVLPGPRAPPLCPD